MKTFHDVLGVINVRLAGDPAVRQTLDESAVDSSRDDPLSTTFPDPDHSLDEQRYLTIGSSLSGRILVVAHTDRDEAIRLISARPATPSERKFYEQGQ